jgi:hypothetical protein
MWLQLLAFARGTMPHGHTPTLRLREGVGSPRHPRPTTRLLPGASGDPPGAETVLLALVAEATTTAPKGYFLFDSSRASWLLLAR